ncbi:MAG TPA: hypothetical protein VF921_13090 [Vicinamibacterales bacterium]
MKKPIRGKRRIGLTSAIGPKATTIVVICVMAGGILVAARQQGSKPKGLPGPVMSAELTAASPATASKTASKRAAAANAPASVALSTATSVTVTGAAPKAPSVTLTGCLERSDQTYRLKDATGADAPKARSWKSGFLKKGPATIDVVDGAHSLKLADQVGHRVSLTGTLVDREMQARSLRRVASSCSARP